MSATDPYQIFISYRRDGGENLSRLIEERLTRSGYKVFLDVEALREGNFDEALYNYIEESRDVIVVLPPRGLDRCASKEDYVRREIAYALEHRKNVIPFMMRNFEFPANLPEDIAGISKLNGINENHEYFDKTIEKLVSFLQSAPSRGDLTNAQLRQAAERGNIHAMNDLALRYEFGSDEGVRQAQAFEWYRRAAKEGDPAAIYNLADIYEQCANDVTRAIDYGIGNFERGEDLDAVKARMLKEAIALYEQARKLRFNPAAFRLGNLAEERRDFEAALAYYREADPYPPALNAIGYYFQNGIAVPADYAQARAYFQRAANGGYAPAMYNYARILELSNPDEAIQLYRRIAFGESAIPEAAYCLGKLHESRGEYMQAVNSYRVAFEGGILEAEQALRKCQEYSLK